MIKDRSFLPWDRACLPQVVNWLAQQYPAQDRQWDLRTIRITLPGKRAGRRLLELLVEHAHQHRVVLAPPRLLTESSLADSLVQTSHPLAHDLLQQLAWTEAIAKLPSQQRRLLILDDEPDKSRRLDSYLRFTRQLMSLWRDLAGDQTSFPVVAQKLKQSFRDDKRETKRWEALAQLHQLYLDTLQQHGFADPQQARLSAITSKEFSPASDIVLVSMVDLQRTSRQLLELTPSQVFPLVHADPGLADRFDDLGCILPNEWTDPLFPIDDAHITIVEDVAGEVSAVVNRLAQLSSSNSADEITLGVLDANALPWLKSALLAAGVQPHWAGGTSFQETRLVHVLTRLARLLRDWSYASLVEFIRLPEVLEYLNARRGTPAPVSLLGFLDTYQQWHLPNRIPTSWQIVPDDTLSSNEQPNALSKQKPPEPSPVPVSEPAAQPVLEQVESPDQSANDQLLELHDQQVDEFGEPISATIIDEHLAEFQAMQKSAGIDPTLGIPSDLLALGAWLKPMLAANRPISEWANVILQSVNLLFAHRDLDPVREPDHELLESAELFRSGFETLVEMELLSKQLGERALSQQQGKDGKLERTSRVKTSFDVVDVLHEYFVKAVSSAQAIDFVLNQLQGSTIDPAPSLPMMLDEQTQQMMYGTARLEMLGWLELHLDDAKQLLLISMNDQYVPSAFSAHPFLSHSIREKVDLTNNHQRVARDMYILSALRASRQTDIFLRRVAVNHDPLLPSRLLLKGDSDQIRDRLSRFLKPSKASKKVFAAQHETQFVVRPPDQPIPVLTSLPVTAFRDYIACPYRFYLRHVLKLRGVGSEQLEMPANVFGDIAHHALKRFGEDPKMRDSTNAESIADFLVNDVRQEARLRFGDEPSVVLQLQVMQLQQRLRRFAEFQAYWAHQGNRIVIVEHKAKGAMSRLVVDGVPFHLSGRIDRIDLSADGKKAYIFDYKTGEASKGPNPTHQSRGEWIDLQLPLYRHLVADLDLPANLKLGFIALPKSNRSEVQLAEWDQAALSSADARAADIIRKVRACIYWPPTVNPRGFFDDLDPICNA